MISDACSTAEEFIHDTRNFARYYLGSMREVPAIIPGVEVAVSCMLVGACHYIFR